MMPAGRIPLRDNIRRGPVDPAGGWGRWPTVERHNRVGGVRILAPVRSKRGSTRAAVVELVARSRGAWVEVRMAGEE